MANDNEPTDNTQRHSEKAEQLCCHRHTSQGSNHGERQKTAHVDMAGIFRSRPVDYTIGKPNSGADR